jgi:hypothetical protein
MSLPPPLPVKSGTSSAKVVWIAFGSLAGIVTLALAGLIVYGLAGDSQDDSTAAGLRAVGQAVPANFTPQDIEERCRRSGLEYYALARDSRLSGRASEAQQEKLAADGIKVYRAKISKRSNVVYIISIIEAPRPFSSGQAKEVLEMLAPSTPVAISGRYIYCNAGRPDPRSMSDEVIWMPPQELYESLGR